ncbi:Uncharacterized protein BP5553_02485 [Venustampulla echinocandica]|uniref:Cytochrome P450 n=1 Tax=Venustampulla echinocandica TaxID=2656787 RepID=A0A370U401_9HELO|nr:Uncharacterized protein BP5553_02485 [Venustampulla echinocandica]RDL42506.1 Uncharacterized protein BP5553_02485 [Venustampulla echinocandica]
MAGGGFSNDTQGNNLTLGLLTILGLFIFYPIAATVYNLCFHPLAGFPGPPLWKASRVPYIISLLRGNLVKDQLEIHRKYGDVVRLAPNEISFTKEEAWQDIYVKRPGHQNPTKDPVWYKAPDSMPENIVTAIDSTLHSRFRKLLGNSFTEKALCSQTPLIESYADLLINRLRSLPQNSEDGLPGVVVNFVDWMSWFTFDIIGEPALGESFDCLKDSKYHPWVETLNNFLKGMVYAASTRWYPGLETLMFKLLPKRVMEMQRQHSNFANEKINQRLNLETNKPDFVTPFMEDNADFRKISLRETQSNLAILIVAGADATATALSGILLYLVQNQEALATLTSEIRNSFLNEEDISIAATNKLIFLNSVLMEGLRLTNPVPGGLPRIVPEGSDTYAGIFIPARTTISVRPYTMSRSKIYFAEPNSFVPERWLPQGIRPTKFDGDRLGVSNPFSIGHSNCLGKNLAMAEMRIVIARILWAFDLHEHGKRLDWTSLKTLMIIQKQPVQIKLTIRKSSIRV